MAGPFRDDAMAVRRCAARVGNGFALVCPAGV